MRLLPKTLLWRTFLLIAALMLLSVVAWFQIFTTYEREPRARQLSQLVVSVVNLTRTALITARPEARIHLLRELSDREGIHIYPAEPEDKIVALPERPFLNHVRELLRNELGPETQLTLERDGEQGLFVSFNIEDDAYWVALPRERAERHFPVQWLGWGAAVLVLALFGAWLVMFRVTRPLKALERAAAEIGRGQRPAPVVEAGPEEIRLLARNFNQMSTDLARLDEDRALILAGVSHDLRTPLTRLRMGIEMSIEDEATRQEMSADIDEMDRSIGQFLDFARADGGEPPEAIDLAALLEELAEQYNRRGHEVVLAHRGAPPRLTLRPKAIRRAIGNLVDNALRHAGAAQPIELAVTTQAGKAAIEVRDRGPGIPAAEAERLKLPFTRLQSARTDAIGTGLGLAIVDRIARSHGGSFDLLPREGGGLVARLTLPIR
ncbi:MAG: HAMP domain-containing protein [Rhodocyclales bacterium]|nr:HAMP domain-containing protein [Rhodocyclales bacterium]